MPLRRFPSPLVPSFTVCFANMLIPKKNRKTIYEALFNEGCLVAKKDFNAPKHSELDLPNLQVIKACQSLTSRGYVRTSFSWQYYYYYLTDEGIMYLREYLHLPPEIVPATHKKAAKPMGTRAPMRGGDRDSRPFGRGDRDEYRSTRGDRPSWRDEKKEGAGDNFSPAYRGGFGRGRPAQ